MVVNVSFFFLFWSGELRAEDGQTQHTTRKEKNVFVLTFTVKIGSMLWDKNQTHTSETAIHFYSCDIIKIWVISCRPAHTWHPTHSTLTFDLRPHHGKHPDTTHLTLVTFMSCHIHYNMSWYTLTILECVVSSMFKMTFVPTGLAPLSMPSFLFFGCFIFIQVRNKILKTSKASPLNQRPSLHLMVLA